MTRSRLTRWLEGLNALKPDPPPTPSIRHFTSPPRRWPYVTSWRDGDGLWSAWRSNGYGTIEAVDHKTRRDAVLALRAYLRKIKAAERQRVEQKRIAELAAARSVVRPARPPSSGSARSA
jgi:hypothetical protein